MHTATHTTEILYSGRMTEFRFYAPLDTKQVISEMFFPANL